MHRPKCIFENLVGLRTHVSIISLFFIAKKTSAGLGAWLTRVGTIDQRLYTRRFNRSLLYGLIRQSPFDEDRAEALSIIDQKALSREISELESFLENVEIKSSDSANVRSECQLIIHYLKSALEALSNSATSAGPELTNCYSEIWRKRFRKGGLEESQKGFS